MASHAGKVIIITYAARGFGLYLAEFFLALGAIVVLADPDRGHLDTVKHRHAKDCPHYNGRVQYQHCDHSNEASVRTLCTMTHEHFKQIDVIIHHVPINDGYRPAGECETSHWHNIQNHTVNGAYHFHQHALPIFQKQHKVRGAGKCAGQIIHLCSNAGVKGAYAGAACTSAQWGIIGLSHNTSCNYASQNIYSCVGILGKMSIEVIEETVTVSKTSFDLSIKIYSEVSVVQEQSAAHHIAALCHGENAQMANGCIHHMNANHPSC